MIMDGLHKSIRPSTYPCDLCAITYHSVGKRKEWRSFLKSLNINVRFYYLDSIPSEFDLNFAYPAILRYENSSVSCILDKHDFESINDLSEFIVLLKQKVPELSEE